MARCGCFEHSSEQKHPLFVCLYRIANTDVTHISIATNPFFHEHCLNGKVKGFPPLKGAPHWQLEMSIGPFSKGAGAVKDEWSRSRTVPCRVLKGFQLAKTTPPNVIVPSDKELCVYTRDQAKLAEIVRERQSHGKV